MMLVAALVCGAIFVDSAPLDRHTIYVFSSETNINNYSSLKAEFDNYLSALGSYRMQPFSERETFESAIAEATSGVFLLSSWHYRSLRNQVSMEAVLVGVADGKSTQSRVLTSKNAESGDDSLHGLTVAAASSDDFARSVLQEMLGATQSQVVESLQILTVPKDIDALLAVGFDMADLALTTERSLVKLAKINPNQHDRLKRVASSAEILLPVTAVSSAVGEHAQPVINVMIEMGALPRGATPFKNARSRRLEDSGGAGEKDAGGLMRRRTVPLQRLGEGRFLSAWTRRCHIALGYMGILLLVALCTLHARDRARVLILNSDLAIEKYLAAHAEFRSKLETSFVEIDLGKRWMDEAAVEEAIIDEDPDVIYCIGSRAYLQAYGLAKDKHLVFSSIINWQRFPMTEDTYGVANELPSGVQVTMFRYLFPDIGHIGILYSEEYNTEWVTKATEDANQIGLKVVSRAVEKSDEVVSALEEVLPLVDAFWLISDPMIISDEQTVKSIFEVADRKKSQYSPIARPSSTWGPPPSFQPMCPPWAGRQLILRCGFWPIRKSVIASRVRRART